MASGKPVLRRSLIPEWQAEPALRSPGLCFREPLLCSGACWDPSSPDPRPQMGRGCEPTWLEGAKGGVLCAPSSVGAGHQQDLKWTSLITAASPWASGPALFFSKCICKPGGKLDPLQLDTLPLHTILAEAQVGRKLDRSQVDRRVETKKQREQLHLD